jgi:DNA-binding FadR family transcriptional regulator
LREAFRILESESLIQVRRGARGGARVQVPNGDVAARYAGYVLEYRGTLMSDVFVARAEVEAPLARLLTERAKASHIKRLEKAVAAAAPYIAEPEIYDDHDLAFHRLIAELSGNSTLNVIVEMLYHIVGTARRRYSVTAARPEVLEEYQQVHKTHQRLVELVKAGDPVAAETFWRRHLMEVNRHYLARPVAKTVVEMMGI